MKKKIMLILLVVLCIAAPVFAGSSYKGATEEGTWGIGLNLGTNTGVGLKFGMDKFDIVANIGIDKFSFSPFSLGGDVTFAYEVYDIDIDRQNHLPITVGASVNMGAEFGDDPQFKLSTLAVAGIEYTIPTVPINLFFRFGLGVQILPQVEFDGSAYIGALWMFE